MEHQVQGSEFVDGEWVTRSMDIYRVMARARQQESTDVRKPEAKPQLQIPQLGLLSKTLFSSPYVKFILPANIRQRYLNDVVFIGEDSVHLKEARIKGILRHVASKTDIKGRILAARVFGNARKLQVKAEHGTPIKRKDAHTHRTSTAGDEADILPPEVIALTLEGPDSSALIFLWAESSTAGSVKFCHKSIRLPAGTPPFIDRLGTFLAIDPKCRAIAVSARDGQFILYKTKNIDVWREAIRSDRDSTPIEDEKVFPIEGRVIHMEFLSPGSSSDDHHVVLLFVIAHSGRTKITCYDWDARYDLSTVTARAERVSINAEDHNPSLLIPLSRSPDFLLVFDRHITTYGNILSGTVSERRVTPILGNGPIRALRPGDGRSHPHWVQWERVVRNADYSMETLYIAREDGKVLYAEVGSSKMPALLDAGQLPHSVDKAFASLDLDSADVLVAAGTASDGCLSKIGSWEYEGHNVPWLKSNTFDLVESIPNWSPVADLAMTHLTNIQSPYERKRDSIFIANGRAPHGGITELRRGIRALIDEWWDGMRGCTRLSIIDYGRMPIPGQGYYAVLLVTLPPETLVLRAICANGVQQMEQIPGEDQSLEDGILRDETISAGLIADRVAVQVTLREARTLSRPGLAVIDSRAIPNSILSATTDPRMSYIAVAYREHNQPTLRVLQVTEDGHFSNELYYQLPYDPTCVQLMNIDGVPHVFVGTTDSSLCLLKISQLKLDPVCQFNLNTDTAAQRVSTVCESAVLLKSDDQHTILCGTRDGMLASFTLSASGSDLNISSTSRVRMGSTGVHVTRCATDSSLAFAACGSDFCRVRPPKQNFSVLNLKSIWFSDFKNDNYDQSPITGLDQLRMHENDENAEQGYAGFLFAVSGDKLLIAQLEYDIGSSRSLVPEGSRAVPRRLTPAATSTNSNPTPGRLLYTDKLRKMIVAVTEPKEERAPPNGYRTIQSSIQLIKPIYDEAEIIQEDDMAGPQASHVVAEYALKSYERVYAILEWIIHDNKGRPHHFVYVGTGIIKGPGQEYGRRLFFNVVDSSIKLKYEKSFEEPVRCMALYDQTHLITIIGKTMIMEEYEYDNAKWARRATVELLSAGVHLSVSQPFVYVSTASHSHICYEYIPGTASETQHQAKFETVFTDSKGRKTAHHLILPLELSTPEHEQASSTSSSRMDIDSPGTQPTAKPTNVILLSDKQCNVACLLHPPQRMHKSDTHTLFEAQLPRSVTRLQRGNIRPPWCRPYDGTLPGVLVDDIIGACTDGTMYSFSILTDPALKLLKFVQNLIELKESRKPENQHSVIEQSQGSRATFDILMHARPGEQSSSQSSRIKVREVDPDEGKQVPKNRFVDADVILRFFNGDILGRNFNEVDSLLGLLSADAEREVGTRFAELAQDVGFAYEQGEELELVKTVGEWMRNVTLDLL